jgi:hypothetical protein
MKLSSVFNFCPLLIPDIFYTSFSEAPLMCYQTRYRFTRIQKRVHADKDMVFPHETSPTTLQDREVSKQKNANYESRNNTQI